jgi:hypothetical protein
MFNKPTVYLAGGMNHSDWQSEIESTLEEKFIFFNPRKHNLEMPQAYTVWDLHFVKKCDILFAYMERNNPSGFGLTLEIGLARGLDKTIILIDEKSKFDEKFANYFRIVRESSSIVFDNFTDGLIFLEKFDLKTLVNF